MIGSKRSSASSVHTGSDEIRIASEDLSNRNKEQAASLEEINASQFHVGGNPGEPVLARHEPRAVTPPPRRAMPVATATAARGNLAPKHEPESAVTQEADEQEERLLLFCISVHRPGPSQAHESEADSFGMPLIADALVSPWKSSM